MRNKINEDGETGDEHKGDSSIINNGLINLGESLINESNLEYAITSGAELGGGEEIFCG